jgi:hypothetical protein
MRTESFINVSLLLCAVMILIHGVSLINEHPVRSIVTVLISVILILIVVGKLNQKR